MEYDLNQLAHGKRLQRLVNAILKARFGEDAQLTPLGGADDGSDGGAIVVDLKQDASRSYAQRHRFYNPLFEPPRAGRYLFQVKFHKTGEQRLSDLRTSVVREFKKALQTDVLARPDRRDVDYFFLVTNVSASKESIRSMRAPRRYRTARRSILHADIWWRESIIAFLDWAPHLWAAYPEIFPGGTPPLLAQAYADAKADKARAIRLAIAQQYGNDEAIRFQQIELEQKLTDLFVDLDLEAPRHSERQFPVSYSTSQQVLSPRNLPSRMLVVRGRYHTRPPRSALEILIDDNIAIPRILLEGGPGQGKSTITQMVAQIYRAKLLGTSRTTGRESDWSMRSRVRLPFRIELRDLAQWLSKYQEGTIDQYLAETMARDSGGTTVTVEDIHAAVGGSSVILIFDGLDEIGNDSVRDTVLDRIVQTANRFGEGLGGETRVILTTRPPAVSGRRNKLEGFTRMVLSPMNARRIDDYVERWLKVQHLSREQLQRIPMSFDSRRHDPHVNALARNPMQLSVLLQFIARRGEAFPDRRAELYREYFQVVIDRDVEKTPELAEVRDMMESLHSFLGFRLHGAAEIEGGRRSFGRQEVVALAVKWLEEEGYSTAAAFKYFALGEERFGLIVAVSGEGTETRYGFEIQPIQEYFAASHISNRLRTADANDVFEWLIQRPYWREVALFLGGLRRSNEKADLIARARQTASCPLHPWDHSGHAIVLALLQEAVLSQPRHVLVEAIRFMIELVESPALRFHPEIDDFIGDLGTLICRHDNVDFSSQIVDIAMATTEIDDEHLIFYVYKLAASSLSWERFLNLASKYPSTNPEILSTVRLECAYHSSQAMQMLGRNPSYWVNIPLPILSTKLWRTIARHRVLDEIKHPSNLHYWLLVRFSTNQTFGQDENESILEIRGTNVSAVWKLQQNLEALNFGLVSRTASEGMKSALEASGWSTCRYSGDLDFSGLESCETCVRELIESSEDVLLTLPSDDEALVSERLVAYLTTIQRHLSGSGLTGWVACRCGVELVQRWELLGEVLRDNLVEEVFHGIYEYCSVMGISRSSRRIPFEQKMIACPSALRVVRSGDLVPMYSVMHEYWTQSSDGNIVGKLDWIFDVPLRVDTVRSLVNLYRADLTSLMRYLGVRTVVGHPGIPRLRIQDIHKILGICRKTDDPEILKGAATLLLNATFERIAEPELVCKILCAAPTSQLVERILDIAEIFCSVDGKTRAKVEVLSRKVAGQILDDPDQYSCRIVNFASSFLFRSAASSTCPLFEDRPELVEGVD